MSDPKPDFTPIDRSRHGAGDTPGAKPPHPPELVQRIRQRLDGGH
jgi:hypothetical protein